MIALWRSEILRFRSRSLVAAVVTGGIIMITVVAVTAGFLSTKPTARQEALANRVLNSCPRDLRPVVDRIRNGGGGFAYYYYYGGFSDSGDTYGECYDPFRSVAFAPQGTLPLAVLPLLLLGSSVIFVAVGIYFGASLVGADWHHRSMTTLLTWESRRGRVYVARMGTVIAGTFLVVLGLEAFGGVSLAVTATLKGTLFGIDGLWIHTTLDAAVKVAGLAAVAAAITASVAMMCRSTGAALGLLIAYFGYEQLMQAINQTSNFWVLARSAFVFLSPADSFDAIGIDRPAAIAALAMYTSACLIAGFLVFDRRDVS